MSQFDVEFSLALNNRTGKFFALREMIEGQRSRVGKVRFWRFTFQGPPEGLLARVLGRLMTWEIEARVRAGLLARLLPLLRPSLPVLFTDPLQTLLYQLRPSDIVVVHDLGPVSAPEFYAPGVDILYGKIFEDIAQIRPHLVFVSEASRDAFVARYGQVFASAEVIYNPIRAETVAGYETAPANVTQPFLLCVGAVGARKNQAGALRGFRLAGLSERGFQFVICGGPEPGHGDVLAEAAKTPGARVIGYADEAELRWLYGHTAGFVLASWLEGFGIPAAEAIQRDLLPVLSTEPALQEVAGPSAVYVEAQDDNSIAEGMLALLEMVESERHERLEQAREHLRKFSPDRVRTAWSNYFAQLASSV